MTEALLWLLEHITQILTVIGLFLTAWTLWTNHDWNRRQYAVNMLADWNARTSIHRKAIESLRPRLVDVDKTSHEVVEITGDDATKIYGSLPTDSDTTKWELRFHFVELLNYFEFISVAYSYNVADQQIIEESFRNVLERWYDILHEFINVVAENRRYKNPESPWQPYVDLIKSWKATTPKRRGKTGSLAFWRFKG